MKRIRILTMAFIFMMLIIPCKNTFAAGNTLSDATAISIGRIYDGEITSSNTVDCYKFTIDSSGKVNISLSANIKYLYLYLYDSSGKQLWQKHFD